MSNKIEALTPEFSRVSRSHQAIELEVTALCGLINEINSLDSFWHKEVVRLKYACNVFTGHRVLFEGKEEKKKDSIDFP